MAAKKQPRPGDYVSHGNETWLYDGPADGKHRLRSLDGQRVTIVRGDLAPGEAPALPPDSQARIEALEKRAADLEAENKALKDELEALKQATGEQ
jgi:cell division protein FtsB